MVKSKKLKENSRTPSHIIDTRRFTRRRRLDILKAKTSVSQVILEFSLLFLVSFFWNDKKKKKRRLSFRVLCAAFDLSLSRASPTTSSARRKGEKINVGNAHAQNKSIKRAVEQRKVGRTLTHISQSVACWIWLRRSIALTLAMEEEHKSCTKYQTFSPLTPHTRLTRTIPPGPHQQSSLKRAKWANIHARHISLHSSASSTVGRRYVCYSAHSFFFIFHRYFVSVLSQFSSPYRVEAVSCVLTEEEAVEEKKRGSTNDDKLMGGRRERAREAMEEAATKKKKTKNGGISSSLLVWAVLCVRWCEMMLFYTHSPTVSHLISLLLLLLLRLHHFHLSLFFFFDDVACAPKSISSNLIVSRCEMLFFLHFMWWTHTRAKNPRHFVRSSSSLFLIFSCLVLTSFRRRWQRWKFPVNFFPPRHRTRQYTHSMSHRRSSECAARESMMSWEFFILGEFADMSESLTAHHLDIDLFDFELIASSSKNVLSDPQNVERAPNFLAVCVFLKLTKTPKTQWTLRWPRRMRLRLSCNLFFDSFFHSAILQVSYYIYIFSELYSSRCCVTSIKYSTWRSNSTKWNERRRFSRDGQQLWFLFCLLRLLMNPSRLPNINNLQRQISWPQQRSRSDTCRRCR